ncbi:isocitrate lyase/phosphoenolpyruvate mutase family protein [Devosia sp. 2618]|uniref:isocitrate lyase/PEP mutase family protein n=1 Tax=Devosia sp. 2618 TaxID=3156454 RepID=UPI00339B63EC
MTTPVDNRRADRFFALHEGFFVIPTVWDRLSALAAHQAGFDAVATSSAALGYANGYLGSERQPFAEVRDRLAAIVEAVPIAVSIDMENGYPEWTGDVGDSVRSIVDAGVVAANIEDSNGDHSAPLVDADDHARVIARARKAADSTGQRFFINARTDIFLSSPLPPVEDATAEAIRRARIYAAAGADGVYVPGRNLSDAVVERLAAEIPVPITVLAPSRPYAHWAALGVRRVSLGTSVIRSAYAAIVGQLSAARSGIDTAPLVDIDAALLDARQELAKSA